MTSVDELKRMVPVEAYFRQHGSTQGTNSRWRCPLPQNHENGDAHPSVTIKDNRAKCWSAGCFGEKGGDIFAVVGVLESLPNFSDQKRRVEELAGVATGKGPSRIRRVHRWEDAEGHVAHKIRWDRDGKDKFSWSLNPEGTRPGKGQCHPTSYQLKKVQPVARAFQCEGEHDTDTVNDWLTELNLTDIVATCTPNGAPDVKPMFIEPLYGKSVVYISGDNDAPGRKYVRQCAGLLRKHVTELRHAVVPENFKDWTEWRDSGATAQDFLHLLDSAMLYQDEPEQPAPDAPTDNLAPIRASQLFDEPEPDAPEWVWQDFLPRGSLSIWAAKPKTGKSTVAYELAVKVAIGQPFLGRTTQAGNVFILALEEHKRTVRTRLRTLGAENLDTLHLHIGRLEPGPELYDELRAYILDHKVTLMVLDTLNSFWAVEDENNAQAVTQAVKPLLQLARETEAAIVLIHHARKSDGEHGDEIRGSGALFSLVDTALIFKRHDVPTQRKLTTVSRYDETPPELILELREHGYEALGDPTVVSQAAKTSKLWDAMTDTPTPAPDIGKRAGVARSAAYRFCEQLHADGKAGRSGSGKRHDPYRYFRSVCGSPLEREGPNETKHPTPSPDTNLSPPGDSFRLGVLPLREERKRNANANNGFVSSRGDGGQTKRNECGSDPDYLDPEAL